ACKVSRESGAIQFFHKCTVMFTYEEGRIMLATSVVQLPQ
ncbi:hypothetical protein PSYMO_36987, partial [Pseudomonas amygdali pv. mori str. 301020]